MIRRIGDELRRADATATCTSASSGSPSRSTPRGPDKFLFGTEESHGFLVGQYVRDKDGAAACMLMAELAAAGRKPAGKTLLDKLDSLYWQHGYHGERQVNISMPGSAGMARMKALMQRFRASPPPSLGGPRPRAASATTWQCSDAPRGDMVILDLAEAGQLRRRPPQRHRAEGQVLPVHVRPRRATALSGRHG